jgi:hypothetical protein
MAAPAITTATVPAATARRRIVNHPAPDDTRGDRHAHLVIGVRRARGDRQASKHKQQHG